jgi:hypothetical protein
VKYLIEMRSELMDTKFKLKTFSPNTK